MDTLFMNSENSKTLDPHILLLNLFDKISFKRSDKYVALSNFSIFYTWNFIRKAYKYNGFNIQWIVWITWHMIFCLGYLRLIWTYVKKTWRKH